VKEEIRTNRKRRKIKSKGGRWNEKGRSRKERDSE
jgi:hypothetical protein